MTARRGSWLCGEPGLAKFDEHSGSGKADLTPWRSTASHWLARREPGLRPAAHRFVVGLSSADGSERRRIANRAEVLDGPFERRIQQLETEIDFGIGRSQWRGNAHDPIGRAGAHDVGA
jgi:hypothetical protein